MNKWEHEIKKRQQLRKSQVQLSFQSPEDGFDELFKGRALPIGTIRTHGGKKVQKTANGWRPVKESSKSPQQDDKKKSSKKPSLEGKNEDQLQDLWNKVFEETGSKNPKPKNMSMNEAFDRLIGLTDRAFKKKYGVDFQDAVNALYEEEEEREREVALSAKEAKAKILKHPDFNPYVYDSKAVQKKGPVGYRYLDLPSGEQFWVSVMPNIYTPVDIRLWKFKQVTDSEGEPIADSPDIIIRAS